MLSATIRRVVGFRPCTAPPVLSALANHAAFTAAHAQPLRMYASEAGAGKGGEGGGKGGGQKRRGGGGKGGRDGGKGGFRARGGKGGPRQPKQQDFYAPGTTDEDKAAFKSLAEDFKMPPLKPGKVRASDLKAELLRGMSAEDRKEIIEVEVPPNPANALIRADASLLSETVMARRVNKATKGGRTEKFSLLVVIGDGNGLVGIGTAKGTSYFDARQRAVRRACRDLFFIDRMDDRTLFHELEAKTQASKVIIIPAAEGTGLVANHTTAALCRMAGIKDIIIKTHGTPNPWAILMAFQKALEKHNTPEWVALKRGMRVHDVSKRMLP